MPRSNTEVYLRDYAEKVCGRTDDVSLTNILNSLYYDKKLDPSEIVKRINGLIGGFVTVHSLRYWMTKLGVKKRQIRPRIIEKRVSECGFDTVDNYFLARSGSALVDMKRELGLSLSAIQRAYTDFLRRRKAE
jgi:hypothetical protein